MKKIFILQFFLFPKIIFADSSLTSLVGNFFNFWFYFALALFLIYWLVLFFTATWDKDKKNKWKNTLIYWVSIFVIYFFWKNFTISLFDTFF